MLLMLLLLIYAPFTLSQSAWAATAEAVKKNLQQAETYYRFGMEDSRNVRDFEKGLSYLEEAKKLLAAMPQSDQKIQLNKRIADLQAGIALQKKKAQHTFYGVFPLVRFLLPPLSVDPGATGMYELVRDPESITVRHALKKLLSKITTTAQVVVEIKTIPQSRELENEAAFMINALENFTMGKFQEGIHHLTLMIEEHRIYKEYRLQVTATLVNKKNEKHQVYSEAFCRDRRDLWWPLVFTNGILFIMALCLFVGWQWIHLKKLPSFTSIVLFPVIGFLSGRILPWVLIPLTSTIKPPPGTPVILSFWWPLLAGAVLFIGPLLLYYGQIRLFTGKFGLPGCKHNQGMVFIFISLGISAYMAGPLLLYSGKIEAVKLGLLMGGSGGIAYLLGCALDRLQRMPEAMAFIAVILASVLGTALLGFHLMFIGIAALFSLLSGIIAGWVFKNPAHGLPEESPSPPPHQEIPKTIDQLIARARSPFFVQWDLFRKAYDMVFPGFGKKTIVLGLVGKRGTGKTVMAEEIISKLKAEDRKPVEVLEIECLVDGGQMTPFAPLMQALETYIKKIRHLDSFDAALKVMVDRFFRWDFPGASHTIPAAPGLSEFKILAKQLVQQLIHQRHLIVSIDNFHCIDNESQKVVEFLFKEFPVGGEAQILVILSAADDRKLKNLFHDNHIPFEYLFHLEDPNRQVQEQILTRGLGINAGVAQEIITNIGELREIQQNTHWLLLTVINLAQSGAFSFNRGQFHWNPDFKARYHRALPIPRELKELLRKNFEHASRYYDLLVCAGCMGMEFDLEIMACSLGMPSFEVLKKCSLMEIETRMIKDKQEGIHTFQFTSPCIYELVRDEFRVTDGGPGEKVPQLIREYHYRIASCLENSLKTSSQDIIAIANHYYATGISHAGKAVEWCRKATHECCRWYQFEQARQFLKKARVYAPYLEQKISFVEDELMIKLNEAHLRGKQRKAVTDEALNYIKANDNASIRVLLLVIRACHSMGKNDKAYSQEAIDWAHKVLERAQKPEEKAEAHLYIGLGLLNLSFFTKREKRRENLREAESILSRISPKSPAVELLLARCYDSLANDLTFTHHNYDKVMALGLFRNSITIKKSNQTYDLAGLARSYGGLGRLFLEWNRNLTDIGRAKKYFEKDLQLSIQLNDLVGQIKMHSFLGQCCIEAKQFQEAEDHYNKSLQLSGKEQYFRSDRFFALVGLVKVYSLTDEKEPMKQTGEKMVELLEKPGFVVPDVSVINRFINEHQKKLVNLPWFETLKKKAT